MAVHVSTTSVVLTDLPMPPSENNAYPTNHATGRRYASRELAEFKARMAEWQFHEGKTLGVARDIIKLWPTVAFQALIGFRRDRVYCKDGSPKKIDASNFLKVIQDGVSKAIGRDDSLFWRSAVEKAPLKLGDARERCTVILTQAPTIDLPDWHKAMLLV